MTLIKILVLKKHFFPLNIKTIYSLVNESKYEQRIWHGFKKAVLWGQDELTNCSFCNIYVTPFFICFSEEHNTSS